MTPRRSPRLITTSTQALNFDGGLKRSREEDSHKNPEDDDANKLQLEIDCTPKSKSAKMEVSKKSPNKVCRALNMQGSENGAHSNGKNEKEMQAKKGSRNNLSNGVCDETVAKQSQNMGFDEQPNGNGGSRTPKKVSKPLVMTFRAYSKDQILKILQQRLMGLPYQVFQPQALELCARVRIDHMAKALAKTFRSTIVDTIQSLPQHQQIVLCATVKFFRRGKKDATLGEGVTKEEANDIIEKIKAAGGVAVME